MFSFIKKSQFSDNVALKIDFKTMVHSFQPSSHENQEDWITSASDITILIEWVKNLDASNKWRSCEWK